MQDCAGIPFEAADRIVGFIFAEAVPRWVGIYMIVVGIKKNELLDLVSPELIITIMI